MLLTRAARQRVSCFCVRPGGALRLGARKVQGARECQNCRLIFREKQTNRNSTKNRQIYQPKGIALFSHLLQCLNHHERKIFHRYKAFLTWGVCGSEQPYHIHRIPKGQPGAMADGDSNLLLQRHNTVYSLVMYKFQTDIDIHSHLF